MAEASNNTEFSDLSENEEQKNKTETKSTLSIVCPKCSCYPELRLIKDNSREILIDCDNCGYRQEVSVISYLDQLKLLQVHNLSQNMVNYNCIKHNKIYQYFCSKCKIHLCESCKRDFFHEAHTIIELTQDLYLDKINDQIKRANFHLQIYFRELKNGMTSRLQKQLNRLEYSFEECLKNNQNMLWLLELLLDNYNDNYHNYYLINNIRKFGGLNIYNYDEKDNNSIEKLIEYYHNYAIIDMDKQSIFTNKKVVKNGIKVGNLAVQCIKSIHEHQNEINSISVLDDGKIMSCSSDRTVKIFDPKDNYRNVFVRPAAKQRIDYVCQISDNLFACGKYKSIDIWFIENSRNIPIHSIVKAHTKCIRKVIVVTNNRIASCAEDSTIKIWNSVHPYNHIKTFLGHTNWVNSIIQLKGSETLVSGSSSTDGSLRFWNMVTFKCLKVITNVHCCYANSLLEVNSNKLIVGGKDVITIVNLINYTVEYKNERSDFGFVNCFEEVRYNILICGCGDGRMCFYDLENKKITFIQQQEHKGDITALVKMDNNLFASCSEDSYIKIWKINEC